MFVAMNRFRVKEGSEEAFEEMWRNRDSHLGSVPGFKDFHLLRGPSSDGATLYASHTIWANEDAFMEWTRSEAFRAAHKGAGNSKVLYEGPPQIELFNSVIGD